MSILTNPSRFLVNVPELQNVVTSATGISAVNTNIAQLQSQIDTTNRIVKTNTFQVYSGSNITVRNNLYLSNSGIYYNGMAALNSNGVNSANTLSFSVNTVEVGRFTAAGYLGILNKSPSAPLDVNGSVIVRQANLYVSTFGTPFTASMGNVTADGNMYASAFLVTSDPKLKCDVIPYISKGLPTPVEFTWISNGRRDIGVLADDVLAIEPRCVETDKNGILRVDYPKLVTVCLSEIHALRQRVDCLESTMKG